MVYGTIALLRAKVDRAPGHGERGDFSKIEKKKKNLVTF